MEGKKALTHAPQHEVVEAAQAGDVEAFETLVRDSTPLVWAHALRFFGDASSAEDVVQEVFVKVYRGLGAFDGQSSFSTWLYRITRNTCIDMLRAGRRRPAPVDPLDIEGSVADETGGVDLAVSVERSIAALAPEDRDAFNAVTVFGLSYAETADALGVPVGTVKSRVFRARRLIARDLGAKSGGGA